MDSLCLSSLVDTLIDAAYLFGYRERKIKTPISDAKLATAKDAYAFISGTGLEMMIKYFDIDLNADNLRGRFSELWAQR